MPLMSGIEYYFIKRRNAEKYCVIIAGARAGFSLIMPYASAIILLRRDAYLKAIW